MSADLVYLLFGVALLTAVVIPNLLHRQAVSAPIVLLLLGTAIGLLPLPDGVSPSPIANRALAEHLTELCVIVSLMGVGLALDRPLDLRSLRSFLRWEVSWRLIVVAMPLCIGITAVLGWQLMGLAPAAALLLGASLAPTDPVLASDVQVGGPTTEQELGESTEIDESDEVRFSLTSEAGLNDGLAFPFVYAAIFLLTEGSVLDWGIRWLAWELVGKVVLGVAIGIAVGWLLAKLAFRAPQPSLRLAETGEPLLALAAVLLSYGAAESLGGGYGFLAVFACAMTLRSAERGHEYHVHMHESIERLERLLTLTVLLLLGVALTNDLLGDLTLPGVVVGLLLVFVVRPLTAYAALVLGARRGAGERAGHRPALTRGERLATAFFGVRGVGSLYYLSYAAGAAVFPGLSQIWAAVGFTIGLSVLVHGIAATPVMTRLERRREVAQTVGGAA